ncbi:ABC transporter ATP-binding protein [Candidatus Woesebacteria bacterium]|nr:ABC transporter ATP-binding protein [Candidatus Woesebacteria bacterium]
MELLKLEQVVKTYKVGDQEIHALNGVSLTIAAGEYVSIMGPSGSGKSTLLQVMSLLDTPTSGKIFLKEKSVERYSEPQLAKLRNSEIGFVFQQFNLLGKASALQNVELPLIYANLPAAERKKRATALLQQVGLGDRLNNTRAQLSGGQQQRVAIARALVNQPSIVFADEPTGNLDSKSGEEVMRLFEQLHKEGKTIVLVTHEKEVAQHAKRQIRVRDGQILSDSKKK